MARHTKLWRLAYCAGFAQDQNKEEGTGQLVQVLLQCSWETMHMEHSILPLRLFQIYTKHLSEGWKGWFLHVCFICLLRTFTSIGLLWSITEMANMRRSSIMFGTPKLLKKWVWVFTYFWPSIRNVWRCDACSYLSPCVCKRRRNPLGDRISLWT